MDSVDDPGQIAAAKAQLDSNSNAKKTEAPKQKEKEKEKEKVTTKKSNEDVVAALPEATKAAPAFEKALSKSNADRLSAKTSNVVQEESGMTPTR